MRTILIAVLFSLPFTALTQVREFPYSEPFDTIAVPSLPSGWLTSTGRSASGDFITTRSAVYSDSVAVVSTNATIAQWLESPLLDLTSWQVAALSFYERRSGTHTSGVLVEASTDGGATYAVRLSDTLANPGTTAYIKRTIPLPAVVLSNASDARIRWRIVGNGTGSTGTYRLDDVRIEARARLDLRLTHLTTVPLLPVAWTPATLLATVRNDGLDAAAGFTVEFYRDTDHDTLPDPDELFAADSSAAPLQPGDSTLVTAQLDGRPAGRDTILARVLFSGDQNRTNDLARLSVAVGLPRGAVVVSEIMYAPQSPEPEWIEIASTVADTVFPALWRVSDRNTQAQHAAGPWRVPLPPHGYLILTKDSLRFRSSHPGASGVVAVPGMPTSLWNNDSDAVLLFDDRGGVMDSVPYHARWGGTAGRSLERIEPQGPSADSMNWGSSEAGAGSTPGAQNYLTPLDTNLRSVRLGVVPVSDTSARITLTVRNIGRSAVDRFSAALYLDRNADSAASEDESIARADASDAILPGDSATVAFVWDRPIAGEAPLIGATTAEHDMRASDDSVRGTFAIAFPRSALIINEIMFEPAPGRSEYVELYNASPLPVDVREWRLVSRRDASSSSASAALTHASLAVAPGEYLVVAADSSILSQYSGGGSELVVRSRSLGLGNQGDTVMILDRTGRAIDSVVYARSWHNADLEETRGRSLERLNDLLPGNDPRNWSTCADPSGGTPGRRNSLFTPSARRERRLSFSPNPFSPDGDGFEDAVMIGYLLPFTAGTLRMSIYDGRGRLVRRLAEGEPTGASGEVVWDGFSDRRERVPIGIYIVLLEAHDANGGTTETLKGVVVVAARL